MRTIEQNTDELRAAGLAELAHLLLDEHEIINVSASQIPDFLGARYQTALSSLRPVPGVDYAMVWSSEEMGCTYVCAFICPNGATTYNLEACDTYWYSLSSEASFYPNTNFIYESAKSRAAISPRPSNLETQAALIAFLSNEFPDRIRFALGMNPAPKLIEASDPWEMALDRYVEGKS